MMNRNTLTHNENHILQKELQEILRKRSELIELYPPIRGKDAAMLDLERTKQRNINLEVNGY